jgi:deoxycytidylate deaminase
MLIIILLYIQVEINKKKNKIINKIEYLFYINSIHNLKPTITTKSIIMNISGNNCILNRLAKKAFTSELLMRHSAMIIRSGKKQTNIIGHNHYTPSKNSNNNQSIHAECDTINKFIWNARYHDNSNDAKIRRKLKKIRLFITRLNNSYINGNSCYMFSNSDPCIECLKAIKNYGIKKIVVSNQYGECNCKKGKYN